MSGKVLIASDHAGLALKAALQAGLPSWDWRDLGPSQPGSVDYPDFAERLALLIAGDPKGEGILICGSGIGMSITANKFPGVRAAVAENPVSARLAKEHNRANVLCLGARFVAPEYAIEIARAWRNAAPSSEGRHQARVEKIIAIENRLKGAVR